MPDNELDELADNFFCHLHDHSHKDHEHEQHCHDHESNEKELIDSLNPLRNIAKLRKSILENDIFMVLNKNHLGMNSIRDEEGALKCSLCSFNIGFKSMKSFFC